MTKSEKDLLERAAFLTEAIGRKLRSPKIDLDDLVILDEALEHIQDVVRTVRRMMIDRHS